MGKKPHRLSRAEIAGPVRPGGRRSGVGDRALAPPAGRLRRRARSPAPSPPVRGPPSAPGCRTRGQRRGHRRRWRLAAPPAFDARRPRSRRKARSLAKRFRRVVGASRTCRRRRQEPLESGSGRGRPVIAKFLADAALRGGVPGAARSLYRRAQRKIARGGTPARDGDERQRDRGRRDELRRGRGPPPGLERRPRGEARQILFRGAHRGGQKDPAHLVANRGVIEPVRRADATGDRQHREDVALDAPPGRGARGQPIRVSRPPRSRSARERG